MDKLRSSINQQTNMSIDDYAQYIIQKHRLCTALAIIKTKPTDLTMIQHMDVLKNKIDDEQDDDFDITVCSDDFIMEDDELKNASETLLKDYNIGDENGDTGMECNDNEFNHELNENIAHVAHEPNNTPKNLTQTTYYEESQNPMIRNPGSTDKDKTFCEDTNKKHNLHNNLDIQENAKNPDESASYDTQKTILYTVHGFTHNCTHYSPSQNNITIHERFIHNVKMVESSNARDKVANIEQAHTNDELLNNNQNINIGHTTTFKENIERPETAFKEPVQNIYLQRMTDVLPELQDIDLTCISNREPTRIPQDNELEQILNESEQNFENMIKSQTIDKYLDKTDANNKFEFNNVFLNEIVNNTSDNSHYFDVQNAHNETFQRDNFDNQENHNDAIETDIFTPNVTNENIDIVNTNIANVPPNNNEIQTAMMTKLQALPKSDENINSTQRNNESMIQLQQNNDNHTTNTTENLRKADIISQELVANSENIVQNTNISTRMEQAVAYSDNTVENVDDTAIAKEDTIPFKVLSELKQVKLYLLRDERGMSVDGYSTDSGYRSDSQPKGLSRRALQTTGSRLDESAQCLLEHIICCPLAGNSKDITTEIAEVLGQLIDRLHEQESCPPFLEALVQSIDDLLKELHDSSSSVDVLLKIDTIIQRLTFLNKSVQIQKYSIQKLTAILVKYHSKLNAKDELYELTNTDQVDNLYHIFHILEELLQLYVKQKHRSTQESAQSSQDDSRIFKKSSLTEIWKRKWDSNYKETAIVTRENKCILIDLGDVLNKIIVDCMNGYSLVSYAALKSFNLLQS